MHISAGSIPASPVAGCSSTIPASPATTISCALFIARKLMQIRPGMFARVWRPRGAARTGPPAPPGRPHRAAARNAQQTQPPPPAPPPLPPPPQQAPPPRPTPPRSGEPNSPRIVNQARLRLLLQPPLPKPPLPPQQPGSDQPTTFSIQQPAARVLLPHCALL